MKNSILPIRIEDAKLLSEWFNTFVDQDVGIVENYHVTPDQESSYILSLLEKIDKKRIFSYILKDNESRIVGKIDLIPLQRYADKHIVEISFGILKENIDEGGKLLSYAQGLLKQLGYEQMIYYILSNNSLFINLFTSCGFSIVGRIKNFYKKNGNYFDRIILQKRIV